MAYNENTNYTEEIQKAIESGASTDVVNQLETERQEKIAANQDKYGQYANDTKDMVESYNNQNSTGTSGGGKSTKTKAYSGAATENITTYTEDQDSVKSAMDANSQEWWNVQAAYEAGTITDAERQQKQNELHNANIGLQSLLGGNVSYDSATGQWSGRASKATETPQQQYAYDTSGLSSTLSKWLEAATNQTNNSIDYATQKAITELQRAEEDAAAQYQTQRNQVDADEARALDNQALYAERRGDKGGIGQAQYSSVMNTAAVNRLTVNQAQTKLATDTARQIADLRAQGAFEKADAYLELTQQYLSQLMSLEQWSAEFGLSVAQFNESIKEWQASYELQVADITGTYQGQQTLASKQMLAEAGLALAQNGITPSSSQLSAMKELYGYDTATVNSIVALANQGVATGGGGEYTDSGVYLNASDVISDGASIRSVAAAVLGSGASKSDFINWAKKNTELSTDSQLNQAWKDYSGIDWYAAADNFWNQVVKNYASSEARQNAIEKSGLSDEIKVYLLGKMGLIG